MKTVIRILFWLFSLAPTVVACFFLFSLKGGSEVPGMFMLPFFVGTYAAGIAFVPVLVFWWFGYKGLKTFLLAVVMLFWPIVPILPAVPGIAQALFESHQFSGNANKTVLRQVVETPVTVDGEPIGVQFAIVMDMPYAMANQAGAHGQIAFCSQSEIKSADTVFRTDFIGPSRTVNTPQGKTWQVRNSTRPVLFDLRVACSPSEKGSGWTTARLTGNLYRDGARYVAADTSKICFEVRRDYTMDLNTHELSEPLENNEFIWEMHIVGQQLRFTKIGNNIDANNDLAEQIAKAFTKISDPLFWQTAYTAMTPEFLQGSGYQQCDKHYPGYYEGGRPGHELVCFCK